ncbi:MAG TPA: DUF378 domain-containing protein [Candidatus Paceibacterota bacterium]|nr:DUF378 domain-containing protein [Candidatus Paceibacterota bacterium]
MKAIAMIGYWLVVIGGLNWGLVGLGWLMGGADWNVVHMLIGSLGTTIEGAVYLLVGLATVWMLAMTKGMPKM